MKIKGIIICVTICLFCIKPVASQGVHKVSGTVLAQFGNPLQGADVVLYTNTDSGRMQITTDKLGRFFFYSQSPKINLKVTHIGYVSAEILNITSDTPITVTLIASSVQLKEVSIVSKKNFVEQRLDRTIINIDGDPKTGINAVDILNKSPGVTVKDGSIFLEGMPVSILINGQPVPLSGQQLMSLLNNMPAINLSQFELMTNPSSKYDAAGNGGIINIKTIKHNNDGLFGSVQLSAGHGWKNFQGNGLGLNLNYGTSHNSYFIEYGNSFGNQYQELKTNTILSAVNQELIDLDTIRTHYFNQNFRTGIDHYFNKNNVVGILVTGYDNIYNPFSFSSTNVIETRLMQLDSTDITNNLSSTTSKGLNLDLNFSFLIDSLKNKTISGNLDGGVFNFYNTNNISDNIQQFQPIPLSSLTNTDQINSSSSHIYSVKADYAQKFLKGTLETGLKFSDVNINNLFSSNAYGSGATGGEQQSDDFRYREAISAAYINFQQYFSMLSIQGGIRIEDTYTSGNSAGLDSIVKRSYIDFFPNITAGYKIKNDLLTVSYSRRIGRPAYNYLNPFIFRESSFQLFEGNPYLKPSFSDNYRIAYSIQKKLTLSATYSKTNDVITDLKLQDDSTKVTTNIKSNLSTSKMSGLHLSYNDELFNLLSINYSAALSKSIFEFNYGSTPVQISQVSGSLSLDNTLNLPRTWWIEIHYYGQTRVTYGTAINLPLSMTDISVGRKLLNKKATLSLRVNDIFFTGVNRAMADYGNVNYNVTSKYDSRNIRLNFSYRFGNSKNRERTHTAGSIDEQGRTQ